MNPFAIAVQRLPRPDSYMIKVAGSVDMKTAIELEQACNRLITTGEERLLFDLSTLEYINSQGLAVLLELQKQLSSKHGGVVVGGSTDRVKKVLMATGIYKVVTLYDNPAEALSRDELFTKG